MTSLKTDTDSHRKAMEVLRGAGYRPLRQFQATKDTRSHKDEIFESWVSPEGKVVYIQFYGGTSDCCFYWPDKGLDWPQTAERLKDPVGAPPKWQEIDSAPKDGSRILAKAGDTGSLIVWWDDQACSDAPVSCSVRKWAASISMISPTMALRVSCLRLGFMRIPYHI